MSVITFMAYSSVMAIVWVLLESPDLAITEAAVGAGVTSVLFFITLRRIHAIGKPDKEEQDKTLQEIYSHKSVLLFGKAYKVAAVLLCTAII